MRYWLPISQEARAEANFQDETLSGFELALCVVEHEIAWIEFRMESTSKLAEAEWKIE